jgi:hypothetical protein
MTDEEYNMITTADLWLSRMWDVDNEIRSIDERRADIIGAKISSYDPKKIRGGSDDNPTESKNIEYATLSQKAEEKTDLLAKENIRTLEVIERVSDAKIRGMLISRYLNRKSWAQIGKDYHYEKSRANDYRIMSLKAVYEFIPRDEVIA